MPTVYDLEAMAYFQGTGIGADERAKVDTIVAYILEPDFQKIREGYGLLWDKEKRVYRACGWSPALPRCEGGERSVYFARSMLDTLRILSKCAAARQTAWYARFMRHMNQFKTEKGTYLFPREYFGRSYGQRAFLSERNLARKRAEREVILREVAGTLAMMEL